MAQERTIIVLLAATMADRDAKADGSAASAERAAACWRELHAITGLREHEESAARWQAEAGSAGVPGTDYDPLCPVCRRGGCESC